MGQRGTVGIIAACAAAVLQVLVQNGVLSAEVANMLTAAVTALAGFLIMAWTRRKPGATG